MISELAARIAKGDSVAKGGECNRRRAEPYLRKAQIGGATQKLILWFVH